MTMLMTNADHIFFIMLGITLNKYKCTLLDVDLRQGIIELGGEENNTDYCYQKIIGLYPSSLYYNK